MSPSWDIRPEAKQMPKEQLASQVRAIRAFFMGKAKLEKDPDVAHNYYVYAAILMEASIRIAPDALPSWEQFEWFRQEVDELRDAIKELKHGNQART